LETDLRVLQEISCRLDELGLAHVFVGGQVVELYVTEEQFFSFRPTEDIDVVLETGAFKQAEHELEASGFRHRPEDGVICRRDFQGIPIDLMRATSAFQTPGTNTRCNRHRFISEIRFPSPFPALLNSSQPS